MAIGGYIWFGHLKKCTGLVLDHLRDFLSLGAPWFKSRENISKLQNVHGTYRQVQDYKEILLLKASVESTWLSQLR